MSLSPKVVKVSGGLSPTDLPREKPESVVPDFYVPRVWTAELQWGYRYAHQSFNYHYFFTVNRPTLTLRCTNI